MSESKVDEFIDLRNLFHAESIAVLGASNNPGKIGGRPIDFMIRYGFKGKIYPINPKYDSILGLPCFPSINEVPGSVDVALIILPSMNVPEAIRQCGEKGVSVCVIFSSGFSEIGPLGVKLQNQITEIGKQYGMRLCGPNTVGIISEPTRLIASFATSLERPIEMKPGNTAFISQSGAFGAFIYSMAQDQDLNFSHFVAVGNEADLEVGDFLGYLAEDKYTHAIGGYLEGINDGKKFLRAVERAAINGKPLSFIKVGKSEGGKQAAQSHTGSLAGADYVYDAIFKQKGIFRADDVQQMLDFLKLCSSVKKLPPSNGIGVMSISGGIGVWTADKFEEFGLPLTTLSNSTKEKLEKVLPEFGSSNNPVDFTAQILNQPEILQRCIKAILSDQKIDTLLIVMGLQEENGKHLAEEIVKACQDTEKLVVVTWMVGPKNAYPVLENAGIPTFTDISRCVRSVVGVIQCGTYLESRKTEKKETTPFGTVQKVEALFRPGPLSEYDSKMILKAWGIPVPNGQLANDEYQANAALRTLSFPFVLKAQSPQLHHKTEFDLVRLGINHSNELINTYYELTERSKQYMQDSELQGILIEEMADKGMEVIVGAHEDEVFGPVVMFGLGGVAVEVMKDVSFRLAPVSFEEALEMINETKSSKILDGFRGMPKYDKQAIAQTIVTVSKQIYAQQSIIKEVEINPLRVYPEGQGVQALDALIIKKD